MRWLVGLIGTLLFTPLVVEAKLELTKIQPAHGFFGPERESLEVYPLDELLIRYTIEGVKLDAEGKTDVETVVRLVNPNGRMVFEQKNTIQRNLSLGGNSFPTFAVLQVPIPDKAPVGEYVLTVQVRDRLAAETASFERKLTCKAPTFRILAPRFFRDPEGKIPAAVGGVVGESLHYRMRLIGFDVSQKKVSTQLTMQVVDAQGKDVLEKPIITKAGLSNPDEVAKATQVNFNGMLTLNRAGEFTLRMTVEDLIGKQKAVFETKLKVTAP